MNRHKAVSYCQGFFKKAGYIFFLSRANQNGLAGRYRLVAGKK